jgi:hypothetical protein
MTTPRGGSSSSTCPRSKPRSATTSRRHGREREVREDGRRSPTWNDQEHHMTAGELAVVLAAVLCCIGFAALIVVLMRVLDTLRSVAHRGGDVAGRDRPVAGRAAAVHRGRPARWWPRPAATSIASTGCSARPRRSAARCGQRPGRPSGPQHAGDQDRRARHGHERAVRSCAARNRHPAGAGGRDQEAQHDEAGHVVRRRRRCRHCRCRRGQEEGQAGRHELAPVQIARKAGRKVTDRTACRRAPRGQAGDALEGARAARPPRGRSGTLGRRARRLATPCWSTGSRGSRSGDRAAPGARPHATPLAPPQASIARRA